MLKENYYKCEYENMRRRYKKDIEKERNIKRMFARKTSVLLQILVDHKILSWREILDFYRS